MSATGQQIVDEAKKFVGDQYVYGAAGPSTFDCSGLVQYSLQQLGYNNVPRTSEAQWNWVTREQQSQLQPGDLIFEQWPGDSDPSPGHVVIYAGSGQVVEAPQPGQNVHVRSWSPNETQIVGYGRVPNVSPDKATTDSSSGSGFSVLDPSTWVPGIFTGVLGSAEKPINDFLERGALIIFGAALIVIGVIRLTGQQKNAKQMLNQVPGKSSGEAAEIAPEAAVVAA